jgi:hypothetical protein
MKKQIHSIRIDAPTVEVTPAMIRAGVATYNDWNPDREEVEVMVGVMFLRMLTAAPPLQFSPG